MNSGKSCTLIEFAENRRKRMPLQKAFALARHLSCLLFALLVGRVMIRDYVITDGDLGFAIKHNLGQALMASLISIAVYCISRHIIVAKRTVK